MDWDYIYQHHDKIFNYFLYQVFDRDNQRFDRQTAWHLTELTLERALDKRAHYNPKKGEFINWLFKIAHNILNDHYRKHRREILDFDMLENVESPDTLEQDVQHRLDLARLRQILSQLPPRDQELIALKYGAGLNNRQLAVHTGLSESNVGVSLFRIHKKINIEWDNHHERRTPAV